MRNRRREPYSSREIAIHLHHVEHADPDTATRAGRAIAAAWNQRDFWQAATTVPLDKCAQDSPGMAPVPDVLDRLMRRFGTHIHPVPEWQPGAHLPRLPAPRPAPTRTCQHCGTGYRCDRTRMSETGYCMRCRPLVEVTCDYCGSPCRGGHDGHRQCPDCRAVPLGVLQLEAKQRAAIAAARQVTP